MVRHYERCFWRIQSSTGIVSSSIRKGKPKSDEINLIAQKIESITKRIKRRPKMLVGKPGLDGHSNGAEQIAVRARDIGIEVVYDGIRSTPEQLVVASIEEGVHIIGLSILSGSHVHLVNVVLDLLKKNKYSHMPPPVIVGGIIPPKDERKLLSKGVKAVFTPKDFKIEDILKKITSIISDSV